MYREFEDLHNMVKKMAFDHLSNSDLLSCQQPVEIKDAKVINTLLGTVIFFGFLFIYFRCFDIFFSDKLCHAGKVI